MTGGAIRPFKVDDVVVLAFDLGPATSAEFPGGEFLIERAEYPSPEVFRRSPREPFSHLVYGERLSHGEGVRLRSSAAFWHHRQG
jgi:hypothetical protein